MNEKHAEEILRTLANEDLLFCHRMVVNARPEAYKRLAELVNEKSVLNEFHKANIARQHEAFAPPHPIMALVACVTEEAGELAGAVLGITGDLCRVREVAQVARKHARHFVGFFLVVRVKRCKARKDQSS